MAASGGVAGAPAFSPEWLACLLGEAEALLAGRVSAAVRARWRREVKLPRMSLEGCLEQLSEARRGREALLARDGPLPEAAQERLQTFLRLEMALLREMQALRERALASAYAVARKGEPGPAAAAPAPLAAHTGPAPSPVVSAAEAASRAKAAAQRAALAEALWAPGGAGDLIAKGGVELQAALERALGGRLGGPLRGLERAVREEGRARVRELLAARHALEADGGWAQRAGRLRGQARSARGRGQELRRAASALRDCLAEAPVERLRPALERALALLEKTDSWWVAWLEKALWAAPLEEAEAARREADALGAALQQTDEDGDGALLRALEGEGCPSEAAAGTPRWRSLPEMRDALQSAPFDDVFALLKQPRALREALRESGGGADEELLAVLGPDVCGGWRAQLRDEPDEESSSSVLLLEKVWALKTETFLLTADLDREEKVAALLEELRALCQDAADPAVPLCDREALRDRLAALQAALRALPVWEVLVLRAKAKALRQVATEFWTEPLAEADGLLAEADGLRQALRRSPLREVLHGQAEELCGALREVAKKKISVLAYYLWNVLWSPLWKKVGDMQRALWKRSPRKQEEEGEEEEGGGAAVQEKLADLEHALDEILEDNLSGLPRILYALPGIVTALQKKVHAVRESLQETPPGTAAALQGKVVAMQEALWKIPFKEAHLMQEELKAYCLALQRRVESWWARRPQEEEEEEEEEEDEQQQQEDEENRGGSPGSERRDGRRSRRGAHGAGASPVDPDDGGARSPGAPSPAPPAVPGTSNPTTGRFQYSELKAIPHSHFQQRKDWYENTDQDLRDYVVQRLVHAIFPASDLADLKFHQVEKVVAYAKKVEGDVYQSTNHWDVYCCLIMVKLFKIEKELQEKRTLRGRQHGMAGGAPEGRTHQEGPLGSQLADPEVPLSPVQDPPGVHQLNPMSIWAVQNTPASLDPPASPPNSPAQTHDEEAAAMTVPVSPPWMPQPQSVTRAPPGAFPSPPLALGQFLPPLLFPTPDGALETAGAILGEPALQGVQGQSPGSPPTYPLPSVAPVSPHGSSGPQSQSASLGPMAALGLSPEPSPQQQQSPPLCLKPAPGPGTLGEPHFGTREAVSHGLLGKRRRLAEAGWRAAPTSPSPSAPPDPPAQLPPVTLESLHRSLEELRISVLRNLGAVHRQVETLEKRIHTLERWRAEMKGRQQLQPPPQP